MLDAKIIRLEQEMACNPEDWGLFREWVHLCRIAGRWPRLDYNAHIPNLAWLIQFMSDLTHWNNSLFVGGTFHGIVQDMSQHLDTARIHIPVFPVRARYYRPDEAIEDGPHNEERYVRVTVRFGGLFRAGQLRFWGREGQNERGLAECARDIIFDEKRKQLSEWGLGCHLLDSLGPARGAELYEVMMESGIAADVGRLRHEFSQVAATLDSDARYLVNSNFVT